MISKVTATLLGIFVFFEGACYLFFFRHVFEQNQLSRDIISKDVRRKRNVRHAMSMAGQAYTFFVQIGAMLVFPLIAGRFRDHNRNLTSDEAKELSILLVIVSSSFNSIVKIITSSELKKELRLNRQ